MSKVEDLLKVILEEPKKEKEMDPEEQAFIQYCEKEYDMTTEEFIVWFKEDCRECDDPDYNLWYSIITN